MCIPQRFLLLKLSVSASFQDWNIVRLSGFVFYGVPKAGCGSNVVINEINANVPLHRKEGEEFLKLKQILASLQECLQMKLVHLSMNITYL